MKINKIGVVGAGMMEAKIAFCFIIVAFDTILSDIEMEFAENQKILQEDILEYPQKKKIGGN